jgi:hypothetical protein
MLGVLVKAPDFIAINRKAAVISWILGVPGEKDGHTVVSDIELAVCLLFLLGVRIKDEIAIVGIVELAAGFPILKIRIRKCAYVKRKRFGSGRQVLYKFLNAP